MENRVDFGDRVNLIVAAVTLILGTGDYTLKFGAFSLGGIGTATFGAILCTQRPAGARERDPRTL